VLSKLPQTSVPAAGTPLPFADVYHQYKDPVYRYCLMRVRNGEIAADIAADVFEAAFRAYGRAQPNPETVHIWLYRIARNRTINHYRRTARWRNITGILRRDAAAAVDDVEDAAEARSDLRAALETVSRLKPRDRELVGLRVGGGLSYQEIAAVMGMSEHAAAVATRRACDRIRDELRSRE
jgi:RNA polymerase sigma-70 factor (ECF subfamily)